MTKAKPSTKNQVNTKSSTKPKKLSRRAIGLIIAGAVVFIAIIALLTGYPQFLAAKIRCGHDPVIVDSGKGLLTVPASYVLPERNDPLYIVNSVSSYYCTEQEAINTGASINQYSRAALERANEQ